MLLGRVAAIVVLLVPGFCLAQENNIYVGVAVMQNYAANPVPGNVEQDRLVKAINQMKPDKKTHVKVQAIPLNAASDEGALREASEKKCQYVVFTRLTELRSANDPYQHQPGAIETNPNSQWSNRTVEGRAMDPEFRATVDYKLVNAGGSAISGAPFSTQGSGDIETVSQIMSRIALQVVDQVKKGTPPMHE